MSKGLQLSINIRSKSYPPVGGRPEHRVLRDIDVSINRGEFVVITGPSGCGKSTMLNAVAGLDNDFDGEVDFGSDDPSLAFMFQTPRLLAWRTVYENISLVMDADDPRQQRIPEMLSAVGLADQATAYPERLSVGMQRRAALARAFIVEPDILLMDEPFVSLDADNALSLRSLLIDLWSARPTTVLFVTHDRAESVMLATRLLRFAGEPATITQDSSIDLTPDQRLDTEAVLAEQARLFADA